MVYGRAPYFHEGQPLPRPAGSWRGTDIWSGGAWIRERCRTAHNCISSPEVVLRNSVARAVGPYDPACTHASDLNMWLRVAAVADVAYVRGVAQALYRVHPDSMLRSGQGPARDLREWRGLQLRRRLGAGRSRLFPPFLATGAAHRLRGHIGQLRWARRGV
jgi:hypothetical protein